MYVLYTGNGPPQYGAGCRLVCHSLQSLDGKEGGGGGGGNHLVFLKFQAAFVRSGSILFWASGVSGESWEWEGEPPLHATHWLLCCQVVPMTSYLPGENGTHTYRDRRNAATYAIYTLITGWVRGQSYSSHCLSVLQ